MKKLIVYNGDSPVYAEGFSESCKRSVKGSIHLLPKKHVTVTDDEYAHIVKKYPELKSKLKVVSEMKEDVSQEQKQAEAAPQGVASAEVSSQDSLPQSEEKIEASDEKPKKKK